MIPYLLTVKGLIKSMIINLTKKTEVGFMSQTYKKGPIVKTGPTAGKVRSRNKDGRWRAKRSDAGIKRK
jgi:hypothetical protein